MVNDGKVSPRLSLVSVAPFRCSGMGRGIVRDVPDLAGRVVGEAPGQRGGGRLRCDQVAGGVALGEAVAQDAADGVGVVVADPRLHGGIDRPGPVGVDGHAGAREFGGEVDRGGLDGGLRGGVGVGADHDRGRRDDAAADVDHTAPAALEHPRQQREGQLGHARDVEGEGAGEFLDVDVGAGAEGRNDRRVVDEDVDAAELVTRAPRERRPGARDGEVGDDSVRTTARRDDGARRLD